MKFQDPYKTAKGEDRAFVDLQELKTLWFNTGTLCNLACENCYIESSPRNDRLSFITESDVLPYLDEIETYKYPVNLIGLTGGEPFINPHIIGVLTLILERGFEVLVLTNAYRSLRKHENELLKLKEAHGSRLKIRVSLDHYSKAVHESERGKGTFDETVNNIGRLLQNGFACSIAGRSLKEEIISEVIHGYQTLLGFKLVPGENFVIFPEIDQKHDVPEISIGCWKILNKGPQDQMCFSERMIVKDKSDGKTWVMPCTLLAYDEQFKLGTTLQDAQRRVYLNHPFCAKFCVLGGASCSSTK